MTTLTPLARFKEFCLDVPQDPDAAARLARFWSAVIGSQWTPGDDGDPGGLTGPRDEPTIALCPVPEAKTGKHRLHFDVYARHPDDLVDLGATVQLPAEVSGFPWTVMTDPDGGEFCCFVREELPDYRLHGVVIDAADPEQLARWWGTVLGVEPVHHNGGDGGAVWTLEHVTTDPTLTFDFVPVPEPKLGKNRIHWDVYGDAEQLVLRGAMALDEQPDWRVLGDPEGNEFCVFAPQ